MKNAVALRGIERLQALFTPAECSNSDAIYPYPSGGQSARIPLIGSKRKFEPFFATSGGPILRLIREGTDCV
jgi:hypothetical protein